VRGIKEHSGDYLIYPPFTPLRWFFHITLLSWSIICCALSSAKLVVLVMGYAPFNICCDYGLVYIVARYMIVTCYLPTYIFRVLDLIISTPPSPPLALWSAIVFVHYTYVWRLVDAVF